MGWPRLIVNRSAFAENVKAICSRCAAHGISVTGVTKSFCGDQELVRLLAEGGVQSLADSCLKNIVRLKKSGVSLPLYLLRIPALSELDELVCWADGSFVSSAETIEAIESVCARQGRSHSVILMFELGDLREGFWPWEIPCIADVLRRSPHVVPLGVATNFGCYGGTIPTREKKIFLGEIKNELERLLGRKMRLCSGGATSFLKNLDDPDFPAYVNNLRIGEGFSLGTDVVRGGCIPWLRQDVMTAEAEIVEVRAKPDSPIGETGLTAFSETPKFDDSGERLRAIAALGRQNVEHSELTPLDAGVKILGASSDHMILDVEDMPRAPRVGDILRFRPGFPAMLRLFTSPYVERVYVDEPVL